jgi:hypothetical protein
MELRDLNARIDQLTHAVDRLSSVLRDMQHEYSKKQHNPTNQASADWIADALRSIDKHRLELLRAVGNRDPYNVSVAAGQFVALNRFFADVSKDWSSSASLLENVFESVFEPAREIAFGIKRLDRSSLEAARRQLQGRGGTD